MQPGFVVVYPLARLARQAACSASASRAFVSDRSEESQEATGPIICNGHATQRRSQLVLRSKPREYTTPPRIQGGFCCRRGGWRRGSRFGPRDRRHANLRATREARCRLCSRPGCSRREEERSTAGQEAGEHHGGFGERRFQGCGRGYGWGYQCPRWRQLWSIGGDAEGTHIQPRRPRS